MSDDKATTPDVNTELRDLARHAQALLDATAGEVDERVRQARERLEARLAEAKRKYLAVGDDFRDTVEATDKFIREKPYHAVGGSFLVGLLLGWFMRGR